MCMKVEACSESARCPHVRSRRYEASVCGPAPTSPHTRTANCRPEGLLVGLHRGKGVAPWSKPWIVDGDSGSPAGRRGWPPRSIHQSVLVLGTICYRPLASEQLAPSAIQRACVGYAGKEALKGLLGWRALAKPPQIASGPPWAV